MCVLTKKALCNWESKSKTDSTQNNSEDLESSNNDKKKDFEPPKKKQRRHQGFKEDPYIYFNVDEPLFKEISQYYGLTVCAQCSKIRKKVQFQKCKNTLFAFSKMAKNQFLHQKKV